MYVIVYAVNPHVPDPRIADHMKCLSCTATWIKQYTFETWAYRISCTAG